MLRGECGNESCQLCHFTLQVSASAASRFSAAAVPTTKRKTPSKPVMEAAVAQAAEEVSCWHMASGAMMRSTCCGLDGFAAGHKSTPSEEGTARAPDDAQERSVMGAAGGG